MHKHAEKISNHVKLIPYQRPCNTESIVFMDSCKVKCLESKLYLSIPSITIPGNPGINLQNLANPGYLCNFFLSNVQPQDFPGSLNFDKFYTFPPLSRSQSLELTVK